MCRTIFAKRAKGILHGQYTDSSVSEIEKQQRRDGDARLAPKGMDSWKQVR